jgi:PQQ-dependent catabolism-associated CXXCW motif protein
MSVRRATRRLVLCFVLVGEIGARAQTLEAEGYRMDNYRAPTPETVPGGVLIDTEAAYKLWKAGGAIWVDVLPVPRRPENLPPHALWMPVPRRNIPGSLWLPDVGRGALNPQLEAYFRTHLDEATDGINGRPIVFYCLADCWMSWNATKRAASWGYTQLYWYRDGIDAWEAAGLPTADAEEVPRIVTGRTPR